ncbi:LysR family transcriptional regulator [Streptomyces sp. NPDC093261]|uniref:LysR family transcriptional regulator n=1 Tax=Streptomyces sp. NPDC093261 TaxID=3366037 RepID=UPI0037F1F265
MRALERELGTPLFTRTTHRVALTPAGEAFLPAARATPRAAELAREAVDAVKGELRGQVTVGIMQGVWAGLHQALAELRAERPGVVLRLRQAPVATSGRPCATARWTWPWWRSTAGSSGGW